MKSNDFLKHFMVIGSGMIISMVISILTTPIITRLVSPEDYGMLSIFNIYVNLAVMILCLGLDQSMIRYYYDYSCRKEQSALVTKCLAPPSVLTLVLFLIFVTADYIWGLNFDFSGVLLILLGVQIYTQLIYRFVVLTIRLDYKSNLYSILGIISKLIYVGAILTGILIFKIEHFFAMVLATVLSGITVLIIALAKQGDLFVLTISNRRSGASMRELIRYGWPFIISMGITQIFQAADKVALNYFGTYADVGIYSSALSLVNIFSVIQITFNSLWTPISVEHFNKDPKDKEFYSMANQYITVVMFSIGLSLLLVKDVFAILLGEKFREAAYILPFLIFNPIMCTISETTVSGVVFMKKTQAHIFIGAISCATNILGNIILVPQFGGKGAAISTGISYIVFWASRTLVSNKYYYVDYKLKRFVTITAVTVLFAWYNTFFSFGIVTIGLYLCDMLLLFVLYRNCVVSGGKYMIGFLKEQVERKRSRE